MKSKHILVSIIVFCVLLLIWTALFWLGAVPQEVFLPVLAAVVAGFCIFMTYNMLVIRKSLAATNIRMPKDPLTNLLAGVNIGPAMQAHFRRMASRGPCCLVALDIVGFHRFNALHSSPEGDQLLQAVGDYIAKNHAMGMRVTGDLFIFLAKAGPSLDQEILSGLERVVEARMGRYAATSIAFRLGIYPVGEDKSFRSAYDRAILSLRQAKKIRNHRAMYFDQAMQAIEQKNRSIEINMETALGKGEFRLYVQPQFSTADAVCCGGEVLVRWQSEELGLLMPDQFIPLFERNGFITKMDQYMLSATLQHMQSLCDEGLTPSTMAVNQSRISISLADYIDRVEQIARDFTVPLEYVEIEITESALADGGESLLQTIMALREIGFTIAMDDFGTGYSSLNVLRTIPVDTLKIDKGFLQASDLSSKDRTIIQSIINMSRELNIHTICEGVETSSQMEFLKKAQCDTLQGYYLAKPVPYEEYIADYFDQPRCVKKRKTKG